MSKMKGVNVGCFNTKFNVLSDKKVEGDASTLGFKKKKHRPVSWIREGIYWWAIL